MADAHRNFAYSTVAAAPSPAASGTSLVVAAGQGARFPTPPFNATVWPANAQPLATNAEIVRVTAIAGDTLTITRTQESSSARSIVAGDQIAATITAKTLTDIEDAATASGWTSMNRAPTSLDAGNPDDQWLDTSTGDVYMHDGSAWTLTGNIRGTAGATGVAGPAGSPGLVYRGLWNPATSYVAKDVVYYLGRSYVVKVASTGVEPTPDGNASWDMLAMGWRWRGPFDPTSIEGHYGPLDAVSYSGSTYALPIGQQAHPGDPPPDSNPAWILLAQKGDKGDKGDAGPAGVGGISETLLDAKGDLIVATANDTPGRLAVGSNGQVLTADSAAPAGVKWAPASGGGGGVWTPSVAETFDSLTDFTFDAGNSSQITLSGGRATPNATGEKRAIVTGSSITDGKAMLQFRTGTDFTAFNQAAEIIARRIDANNFLLFQVVNPTNSTSQVVIQRMDAGTYTGATSVGGPGMTANTDYWIIARWIGKGLSAELWDVDPRLMRVLAPRGAPLVVANQNAVAKFGAGVAGAVGVRFGQSTASNTSAFDLFTAGGATATTTADF